MKTIYGMQDQYETNVYMAEMLYPNLFPPWPKPCTLIAWIGFVTNPRCLEAVMIDLVAACWANFCTDTLDPYVTALLNSCQAALAAVTTILSHRVSRLLDSGPVMNKQMLHRQQQWQITAVNTVYIPPLSEVGVFFAVMIQILGPDSNYIYFPLVFLLQFRSQENMVLRVRSPSIQLNQLITCGNITEQDSDVYFALLGRAS